ncbi:MAG: hypothetical protein IID18_10110, partial [Nitrospinae bacterium]|nr:hypothetical protein [Nitrospinota bacterium]
MKEQKKTSPCEEIPAEKGLSTIGEAMGELPPGMAIQLKALQGIESPVERVMGVIFDVLPYSWQDTELLGEAILHILASEF